MATEDIDRAKVHESIFSLTLPPILRLLTRRTRPSLKLARIPFHPPPIPSKFSLEFPPRRRLKTCFFISQRNQYAICYLLRFLLLFVGVSLIFFYTYVLYEFNWIFKSMELCVIQGCWLSGNITVH